MRPFPTLFYIACIILLGIRLRPASNSLSGVLSGWQRAVGLGFGPRVGWVYRLATASFGWLLRKEEESLLPVTVVESGGRGTWIWIEGVWRVRSWGLGGVFGGEDGGGGW